MLTFAEQTGSGAVMIVWSFLSSLHSSQYMAAALLSNFPIPQPHHTVQDDTPISCSSLTHITCIIYHSPPDQVVHVFLLLIVLLETSLFSFTLVLPPPPCQRPPLHHHRQTSILLLLLIIINIVLVLVIVIVLLYYGGCPALLL
jgi:hypothetical protein